MDNSTGVVIINDGANVSEVILRDIGRSDGRRRVITFGRSPECTILRTITVQTDLCLTIKGLEKNSLFQGIP